MLESLLSKMDAWKEDIMYDRIIENLKTWLLEILKYWNIENKIAELQQNKKTGSIDRK